MKKAILILALLFFILSCADKSEKPKSKIALAKHIDNAAIFNWATESCENTGTFDPKKYTKEELKNTYDLWFTFSTAKLQTQTNAYFIEDVNKLDATKLFLEYINQKALLNRKVVSTPFWNKLKTQRLRELEEEYLLKKITIEAYSDPTVLLNNKYSAKCSEYVQALASNDTIELLKAWRNIVEVQKSKNGYPEKVIEEYNKKYNSKDHLLYAQMELMTYGWFNCANDQIKWIGEDDTMREEFDKIFITIKKECNEED
ncbi:hypothetical protein EV143_106195 [Flavobacterium chryseum]|uniref:hypothetical protein n=1 Tax=Flavobacterium sp. P3160 TaxID=2512113 RepID=UPI00105CD3FA|nr:hypothetical protein [Flavobacterium sp. P3160]TDO73253.1 hypothetical protein EV143_106195 [Flavobacterium sp. P3160]